MKSLDRSRLASLMQREQERFSDERPKSKALFERAGKALLAGVPMELDEEVGGSLSAIRPRSARRIFLRC